MNNLDLSMTQVPSMTFTLQTKFSFCLSYLNYTICLQVFSAPVVAHGGFGEAWSGGESSLHGGICILPSKVFLVWDLGLVCLFLPYSVILSCGNSLTAVKPPNRETEQPNPNKPQNKIQNMFRETCYFKGRCRGPPGAHYSSQWKGGIRESVEWEAVCILFQKL